LRIRSYLNDRPLLLGALLSLLWHFFWFFSITITIGPSELARRRVTRTASLGAVLDDTIFRTLVESRPQVTEAFYRHMSDLAPAPPEPEIPLMDRHSSGDVVSVPFGKKFIMTLKEFIDGEKPSPDFGLGAGMGGSFGRWESLEGQIKDRAVLSRPPRPDFPREAESRLFGAESVVGFSVDPSGTVVETETIISTGDPAVDALWLEYVRGFRFSPVAVERQNGKARLRFR